MHNNNLFIIVFHYIYSVNGMLQPFIYWDFKRWLILYVVYLGGTGVSLSCIIHNNYVFPCLDQGPVLLLRHDAVARMLANGSAAFIERKLGCHWLEFLRQIAVVRQGPGTGDEYFTRVINTTGAVFQYCEIQSLHRYDWIILTKNTWILITFEMSPSS